MTLEMTEIKVPDPQRRWIMCEKHEWDQPIKIVSDMALEDNYQSKCIHCGMTVSKTHIGSRKKI